MWHGKVDPALVGTWKPSFQPTQRMKLWIGLCCFLCLFVLFSFRKKLLLILRYFKRDLNVLPLFLFFTLTHWSKTWNIHMQSIKPKEDNENNGRQVKNWKVDFPYLPLHAPMHKVSCTYTSKGLNYERNVRFHFQFLLNRIVTWREKRNGLDVRGKCRVILSLLVVNVSSLGIALIGTFFCGNRMKKISFVLILFVKLYWNCMQDSHLIPGLSGLLLKT